METAASHITIIVVKPVRDARHVRNAKVVRVSHRHVKLLNANHARVANHVRVANHNHVRVNVRTVVDAKVINYAYESEHNRHSYNGRL